MPRNRRPAGSANAPFTAELSSVLDDAAQDVSDLLEEMRTWQESLESNSMEHLPKYDEVSESVSALEQASDGQLDSLSIPEFLTAEAVSYTQDTRRSAESRSGRLDNAMRMLDAGKGVVEAWLEEFGELDLVDLSQRAEDDQELAADEAATQKEVDTRESMRNDAQQLLDELETIYGELEGVGFPGMY